MNNNYPRPGRLTYWSVTLLIPVALITMVYGAYHVLAYSWLMHEENWNRAAESHVLKCEKASALYNQALSIESLHPLAQAYFNLALAQLVDKHGIIQPENKPFAAEITFQIGNCLFFQRKIEDAKEAYRNALRLDPTHLDAKFNLERLTDRNNKNNNKKQDGDGSDEGGTKNNPPRIKRGI